MRLSNLFIYGSVAIIVAASLGFLIFKAIPGNREESDRLAQKIKTLQRENEELLTESGKTVQALSEKITLMSDDLARASRLLTDKDEEIFGLQQKLALPDEAIIQLARRLNCQPAEVLPAVQQMQSDYQRLQQDLQTVNQQLAQLQQSAAGENETVKADTASPIPATEPAVDANQLANRSDKGVQPANAVQPPSPPNPRIRKLELAGPQNRDSVPPAGRQPAAGPTEINPADSQTSSVQPPAAPAPSDQDPTTQISGIEYRKLQERIDRLEADLKNREKLLYEQTSLIEDLKQKTRIETGLRSGDNVTSGFPAYQPFRDRGTFPIQDR